MNAIVDPFREDQNAVAQNPKRPAIVDPWQSASPSTAASTSTTRPRQPIRDPWAADSGKVSGGDGTGSQKKVESPRSILRTAVDGARRAINPLSALTENTEIGRDLSNLGGGGILTGTGRAIEGIERGVADAFREPMPGRVRFLDENNQPAPLTERQQEQARAWAERNPAYQPSAFSQALKRTGEGIQQDVSPTMKQAMQDSELGGDILSPSTWTLGDDPSARGLLGQVTKVGGEMAPIVAAGAVPIIGPGLAVTAASGQSASGAYEDASDYVLNAPRRQLEQSPRYRELIGAGLAEDAARSVLADEAGRGASGPAAAIGGLSGAILSGAATRPLQQAITNRMGNTFGARMLGNAAEMPMEGLQEVGESVAGRFGANQTSGLDRDLTEGTFGDFVLGAAATGPAAVLHSAMGGNRGAAPVDAPQPEQAEPLAPSPPATITVDADGNAMTPTQAEAAAREREELGLTPDILHTQMLRWQEQTRQATAPVAPFPGATPGTLADAANTIPQAPPVLSDGSPVPDPAGGPLSRVVNQGVVSGGIPTGPRTWEQMQANIALDAEQARAGARREREMDTIARESRLPAALLDAERDAALREASGQNAVESAPSAMQLAMQRAQRERRPINDPWASDVQSADLRFASESRASALPRSENAAVEATQGFGVSNAETLAPAVRFEPKGEKGLLVHGDHAAIRERLAAAGFRKKGRNQDGALRFDAKDRPALEAALSMKWENPTSFATPANTAPATGTRPPIRDPWASPDPDLGEQYARGRVREGTSMGIPIDPATGRPESTPKGGISNPPPAIAPLAAPIIPPWSNPAKGETTTPTPALIRTAVEQQAAAQYQHNGKTALNTPMLSKAWGVPQKDIARITRQVRANFTPASTSAATHIEPGQPPQPATPAVVAESAQTVARAPNVTMAQAKENVLSQIDAALQRANTDAWPDIDAAARQGRRQAAENERDRITQAAGFVTFDVPGDGTFRVVNNRSRLEAFRTQVERQFKNTQPPRGPQLPRIGMSEAERIRIMAEAEPLDVNEVAQFSRTNAMEDRPTGPGLPVENVQRIVNDFQRHYRGSIPLQVRVGATVNDLYGVGADQLESLRSFKGAYHPRRGIVALAADRLSSRADVEATLRHEVLGHYGLNTLAPADKAAILEAILSSRTEPSLTQLWAQTDALYADMPELVRAEEVFAELAGRERGTLGQWWDRVLELLAKALRRAGLLRGEVSRAELQNLARRIGEGIRNGERTQQTFPVSDQTQFSRDARKMPSGVGTLSEQELEVLRQLGLLSQEQEADLSGQAQGNADDGPRDERGWRITSDAERGAYLRLWGRADGELSDVTPESATAADRAGIRPIEGVVRRLSESAARELGGVYETPRNLAYQLGPFSGYEVSARIKNAGTPQEALVVEVFGKEQMAEGIDEEPALTWTVHESSGEMDVNGPNPDRATFREFQKRGWADHARGQNGEIAMGWTALRNPDGSASLPMRQILPMLADVHARYRTLLKQDRVGLHWSRITGATGGPAGREAAVFFSRAAPQPDPFAEENRRLREQDKSIWKKAGQILRREFSPGGLLPEQVFGEKIARDSNFQAVEFDVRHLAGTLEKAVRQDFGKALDRLPEAKQRQLGEALAGKVPDTLPQETRAAVVAMRQYIDALSGEYLGIIQNRIDTLAERAASTGRDADAARALDEVGLYEKIKANIGQYVHRSYRAFDDPQWFKKVPTDVLNAARRYLGEGYLEQGSPPAEARRLADVAINEILKNGTAYDSMEAFVAEGKLGAKDLSVLMRRKDVPPEIRALLGEYTDPRVNFAKSATKMGRLIWNQRFLDRVREIGVGSFLFEGRDRPASATAQLAAEGSDTLAPLNGLWTFPEVAQAFTDALGKEQMGSLYRAIVRANGLVKYGKTVLSPTTAMRNWQSAMFFSLANGHFDLREAKKGWIAFREQVAQNTKGGELAYLRRLKELGVVYDSPYAGEMARYIQDARLEELLEGKSGKALHLLRKMNQTAQGFYSFGDDFWKIIGFENEKAALVKAGIPAGQAETMAAERIRNTYPTYSMVGRGVKWLSRFPLIGTFVSFPAEIVRTTANMLQLTAADLKSDNPGIRAIGRKRAAGMALVSAGFYALSAITRAMFGVGDDEEEALRDLAPPWQKNSTFLYTGRDVNGQLRYFDMSFLDPYGYWKRPITAMMRDQSWEDAAASAAGDMLSPFFGTDISAGAIFEVMANKKGSGGRVYSPNADPLDQTTDIANHLRKALQPGFVGNAERLVLAAKGTRREGSGQPYDMRDEVVSLLGWRASTLDTKTALYYRSFEFTDALNSARQELTRTLRSSNPVSRQDIQRSRAEAERQYGDAFRQMHRLVASARAAGMTRPQIARTLRLSGVSAENTQALIAGRTPPMRIGAQSARNAVQQARTMQGPAQAHEVAQRFREAGAR